MVSSPAYSPIEFMAYRAAKELNNDHVAFVGIGLPVLAANLARATHATNLMTIFESGIFGAAPSRLPLSVGDPALVAGSLSVTSLSDVFQNYLQGGLIDVGLLGGAQIDKNGNINSTVIGDYKQPTDRLPGSGGACEISFHSKKIIVIIPMSPKSFVQKCDFITSPGYPSNPSPSLVVTNLGVCEFENGEMILTELCPGVDLDTIKASCSWPLKISSNVKPADIPSPEIRTLLKTKIDPERVYL